MIAGDHALQYRPCWPRYMLGSAVQNVDRRAREDSNRRLLHLFATSITDHCFALLSRLGVFPLDEADAAVEAARVKGALKVQIICSPRTNGE